MNLKNAWTRFRLWLLRKIYPSRSWDAEIKNSGSHLGVDDVFSEADSFVRKPQIDWLKLEGKRIHDSDQGCCAPMEQGGFNGHEIRDDGPNTLEDLLAMYADMLRDPQRPNVLLVTSTPTGKPNVFAAAVRKQLEAKGFRMEFNAETGFYEIKEPPRTT